MLPQQQVGAGLPLDVQASSPGDARHREAAGARHAYSLVQRLPNTPRDPADER